MFDKKRKENIFDEHWMKKKGETLKDFTTNSLTAITRAKKQQKRRQNNSSSMILLYGMTMNIYYGCICIPLWSGRLIQQYFNSWSTLRFQWTSCESDKAKKKALLT